MEPWKHHFKCSSEFANLISVPDFASWSGRSQLDKKSLSESTSSNDATNTPHTHPWRALKTWRRSRRRTSNLTRAIHVKTPETGSLTFPGPRRRLWGLSIIILFPMVSLWASAMLASVSPLGMKWGARCSQCGRFFRWGPKGGDKTGQEIGWPALSPSHVCARVARSDNPVLGADWLLYRSALCFMVAHPDEGRPNRFKGEGFVLRVVIWRHYWCLRCRRGIFVWHCHLAIILTCSWCERIMGVINSAGLG